MVSESRLLNVDSTNDLLPIIAQPKKGGVETILESLVYVEPQDFFIAEMAKFFKGVSMQTLTGISNANISNLGNIKSRALSDFHEPFKLIQLELEYTV